MPAKATQDGRSARAATRRRRRDELILDALEQLLVETPLRDLGVEEIASAAGITRTRFYYYYKSKHEAYAALLMRISAEVLEVYNLPDSWFVRPLDARPRDSLDLTLKRVLTVWYRHRFVLREASDMWNAVPEVGDHWREIMGGLADAMRQAIDRERKLGVAPPGPDSRRLAQALIWQGERLLFLLYIEAPGAMSIRKLRELGVSLWLRSIYLADDPDPSPAKR
jgi:AcrR family transcriptional regulator